MKLKIKVGDIAVILLVILISFWLIFISSQKINRKSQNKVVIIQVNGKEIKRVELNKDVIGETFEINTEFGHNVLEFGDGCVRSIEADCPDQIDVKQGYIYNAGETIVCLPNRLVVEIIDQADVNDIDVVN